VKHKNRRPLFILLAVSGLLGLAPLWYRFQIAIPVRSTFAQGVEALSPGVALTPNHGPSSFTPKIKPRTQNPVLAAQSDEDTDNFGENALQPQSPTVIESFQINATLPRSTPDPELAERLGLETAGVPAAR
jgi:hypothetical protein